MRERIARISTSSTLRGSPERPASAIFPSQRSCLCVRLIKSPSACVEHGLYHQTTARGNSLFEKTADWRWSRNRLPSGGDEPRGVSPTEAGPRRGGRARAEGGRRFRQIRPVGDAVGEPQRVGSGGSRRRRRKRQRFGADAPVPADGPPVPAVRGDPPRRDCRIRGLPSPPVRAR